MNVNDFLNSPADRFKMLNNMLAEMYGLQIDWNSGDDHLQAVMEHYWEKRSALTEQYYAGSSQDGSEYSKNVLIVEAIRIYLKEIAPRRIKKKFMVKK